MNISVSSSGAVWNYKFKPYPPTNLTDAFTSTNQINLGWTLSSDEPGSIDGFDIYHSNGTLIGSIHKCTNTYCRSGLMCNTGYSFYVRSKRQGVQSNNSNTSTTQTLIRESCMICSPAQTTATNAYNIRRNDSPGSTN